MSTRDRMSRSSYGWVESPEGLEWLGAAGAPWTAAAVRLALMQMMAGSDQNKGNWVPRGSWPRPPTGSPASSSCATWAPCTSPRLPLRLIRCAGVWLPAARVRGSQLPPHRAEPGPARPPGPPARVHPHGKRATARRDSVGHVHPHAHAAVVHGVLRLGPAGVCGGWNGPRCRPRRLRLRQHAHHGCTVAAVPLVRAPPPPPCPPTVMLLVRCVRQHQHRGPDVVQFWLGEPSAGNRFLGHLGGSPAVP